MALLLRFKGMVIYADVDASGYDHDAPPRPGVHLGRALLGGSNASGNHFGDHQIASHPPKREDSRVFHEDALEHGNTDMVRHHQERTDAERERARAMGVDEYAAGYGPCKYAPKPAPPPNFVQRQGGKVGKILGVEPLGTDEEELEREEREMREYEEAGKKPGLRRRLLGYAEQTEGERFYGTLPASQRPRPYVPHGKVTATMIDLEQARRKAAEKGASRGAAGTRIYPGTPITDGGEAEYAATPEEERSGVSFRQRPDLSTVRGGREYDHAFDAVADKASLKGVAKGGGRHVLEDSIFPFGRIVGGIRPEDRTEFQEVLAILTYQMTGER